MTIVECVEMDVGILARSHIFQRELAIGDPRSCVSLQLLSSIKIPRLGRGAALKRQLDERAATTSLETALGEESHQPDLFNKEGCETAPPRVRPWPVVRSGLRIKLHGSKGGTLQSSARWTHPN